MFIQVSHNDASVLADWTRDVMMAAGGWSGTVQYFQLTAGHCITPAVRHPTCIMVTACRARCLLRTTLTLVKIMRPSQKEKKTLHGMNTAACDSDRGVPSSISKYIFIYFDDTLQRAASPRSLIVLYSTDLLPLPSSTLCSAFIL